MTEWFEFNKLLGVTEIHLYNVTLTAEPTMQRLLDHYASSALLKMHTMPPPMNYTSADGVKDPAKTCITIGLQDCLYRNLHRFKYLVVVDVDEVILPYKETNYHDMMTRLVSEHKSDKSFQFVAKNFCRTFPPDLTQPNVSVALRQTQVAPSSTAKSIHNPRRCFDLTVHHCGELVKLREAEGTVHHYRRRCNGVCPRTPQEWSKYRRMVERYRRPLLARLESAHRLMKL